MLIHLVIFGFSLKPNGHFDFDSPQKSHFPVSFLQNDCILCRMTLCDLHSILHRYHDRYFSQPSPATSVYRDLANGHHAFSSSPFRFPRATSRRSSTVIRDGLRCLKLRRNHLIWNFSVRHHLRFYYYRSDPMNAASILFIDQ
jgi:hypothetical protein